MKKTLALLLTLLMLLSLLPVSAMASSVAITPQIAIDCFEDFLEKTPKAQDPSRFSVYKGHFYADLNKDDIPELITVFYDGWNDTCVNVYYCSLSFDMSNGLENSTPVYSATAVYIQDYYSYRDLSSSIGGSGGTTLELVRLKDGRLSFLFEDFGFSSDTRYYTFNGIDFDYSERAAGATSVWYAGSKLPGTYELYPKPDPNSPFVDVKSTDYFYDAVLWALETGVTKGTTATRFVPSTTCTRQQVVTFLYRANGSPAVSGTNPFKDVKETDYSYNAILWAVANGITQGTTPTTFNPTGTCSTAHVLTFLYRAKGCPAVSGAVGSNYYDAASLWAKEIGLYDDLPFGFVPGRNAPRAEIVTYLYGTKDIATVEKPAAPVTSSLADGRYDVYFLREGLSNNGTTETVLVDVIDYVGFSVEEMQNLKPGKVIALSKQDPSMPDIVVKSWSVADADVCIESAQGRHYFWYNSELDNGKGRYVYCGDEFDPNIVGFTYVTREKVRMTVDSKVKIEDWTSASLRTHASITAFFNAVRYGDRHVGYMEVKDGKIVTAHFAYRP